MKPVGIGDRVEVSWWASPLHGKLGTAEDLSPDGEDVLVLLDEGYLESVPAWVVFHPHDENPGRVE